MLEKTLESPMDCKEIQPVHSKGDQSWVFFGKNDVKAETPALWPPDAKSWLIWEKTLMLGKFEGRRRRERQRMRWLDGIINSMDMSLRSSGSGWWTGRPGVLWFMGSPRVGHDWATELDWTEGPSVLTFWSVFIINGTWILSEPFLHLLMIIWFLVFNCYCGAS